MWEWSDVVIFCSAFPHLICLGGEGKLIIQTYVCFVSYDLGICWVTHFLHRSLSQGTGYGRSLFLWDRYSFFRIPATYLCALGVAGWVNELHKEIKVSSICWVTRFLHRSLSQGTGLVRSLFFRELFVRSSFFPPHSDFLVGSCWCGKWITHREMDVSCHVFLIWQHIPWFQTGKITCSTREAHPSRHSGDIGTHRTMLTHVLFNLEGIGDKFTG